MATHPILCKSNSKQIQTVLYVSEVNLDGIKYPVPIIKIPKFEKQDNIAINVFGFEEGELFPVYLTTRTQVSPTCELAPDFKREKSYYCLIKNLNQLLSSQTKYEGKSITVLIVFISLDRNSYLRTTNRCVVSKDLREQSYQMFSSLKISSSESPLSFTLLLRA